MPANDRYYNKSLCRRQRQLINWVKIYLSGSGGIRTREAHKGSGLAILCNWPLCDAS